MSVQTWWRLGAWHWSLRDAAALLVLPLESQPATRLCVWNIQMEPWRHQRDTVSRCQGSIELQKTGLSSSHFQLLRPCCHWPHTLSENNLLGSQITAWWPGHQMAEGVRSSLPTGGWGHRALTWTGEWSWHGKAAQHVVLGTWSGLPSSKSASPWSHLPASELRIWAGLSLVSTWWWDRLGYPML